MSRDTALRAAPAGHGVLEQRRSSPGLLLALLGHAAMRRLRETHTAQNLTPRQFYLLGLLHDRGPTAQSELGQLLDTDPSILVTMLNPLEDRGWISRERDPADRRRHAVTLTAAGERHLTTAAAAQREAEDALLAGLDEGERAQLRDLLLAVEAGLGHELTCATGAETISQCPPRDASACET